VRRDKAYLAVLQWPDAMDEAAQAAAIARAAGLDAYQAGLVARRGTPQIVARLDAEMAEVGAAQLHEAGATALALRQSVLGRAPEPARLKRLVPAVGAPEPMYTCEIWRGEDTGLRAADLYLIVHARLRSTEARTKADAQVSSAIVYGGLEGAAIATAMNGLDSGVSRSSRISVTEMLDLWLKDGSRLRIDGSKFNFDVLGERRSRTQADNMAHLLGRLRAECPRALVDEGFAEFRCPPEFVRSHFIDAGESAVRKTSEAPAFEFYSAWSYFAWRALTGG
jgi:hypothetical protein